MRLAIVLLLCAAAWSAAAEPQPEQCLAKGDVTVTHAGRTYRLASEECRQQFLSDPERYAQLYDALLELAAAGETPRIPSLVPS